MPALGTARMPCRGRRASAIDLPVPCRASALREARLKRLRQAAVSRSFFGGSLRQQITAFLEHSVDILIQRRESLVHSLRFANGLIAVLEDRRRDLLPLRHLRQWHDVVELIAEGL